MIFHSIVFSLGDPQKNEYIYMFLLLLKSLLKTGTFRPQEDTYYCMADAETIKVAKEIPQFAYIKWIEIPKPTDCYEGMTYKYRLFEFVETSKDVVMYIDVDMLALKCSRLVIPPDRIYVCAEGSKWDTNYRGDESCILPYDAGFTAGYFVYSWGERVEATFGEILHRMVTADCRYYTLDQVWFNRTLDHRPGCASFLPGTFISFNGHTNKITAHFLNLAGCVGDGPFHFRKALSMYLEIFTP
jgi:hypothetical protein